MGTFVEVVGTGENHTTISSFASDVGCDLTASSTAMASHGGITGSLAPGTTVRKQSDTGVTATIAGITSTQILLKSISGGTFSSGDVVEKSDGSSNYVTLSSNQDATVIVQCELKNQAFNESVSLTGFTTDASNYVELRPTSGAGHGGVVGSGARIAYTSAGQYQQALTLPSYSIAREIGITRDAYASSVAAVVQSAGTGRKFIRCYIKNTRSIGSAVGITNTNDDLYSCLIYECTDDATNNAYLTTSSEGYYGCTIVDCGGGINANGTGSSAAEIQGTIAYNCNSEFLTGNTTGTCDYNASDIAEASIPGGAGVHNVGSISDPFTSRAGDDYSLASGATSLHTGWVASPPADASPDIAGTTRPSASTASIGAYEYISAAAAYFRRNLLLGVG